MLCSYSIEEEKINVFSIFLENIINGNSSYIEEVRRVFKEVKDLSEGKKTIFSIDRNYFTIIQYLFESNSKYFSEIDLDNIQLSDYKLIEKSLRNKNEFIFA